MIKPLIQRSLERLRQQVCKPTEGELFHVEQLKR